MYVHISLHTHNQWASAFLRIHTYFFIRSCKLKHPLFSLLSQGLISALFCTRKMVVLYDKYKIFYRNIAFKQTWAVFLTFFSIIYRKWILLTEVSNQYDLLQTSLNKKFCLLFYISSLLLYYMRKDPIRISYFGQVACIRSCLYSC